VPGGLAPVRWQPIVRKRMGLYGMAIRFWEDPATGLPHIYRHGVTEDEVRQVLLRIGQEVRGDRGSRIKQGQTAAGRYLQVVYKPEEDPQSVFVVTAFELGAKDKAAYRRRRRRNSR